MIHTQATTYSWTGSGYVVPSACAKAGVLSMTRSLAVEWAKYKIRSNAKINVALNILGKIKYDCDIANVVKAVGQKLLSFS